MRRNLRRSSAFVRDLKRWRKARPQSMPDIASALDQLSEDASHPSLRTHKLKGGMAGCMTCSAGYDLRIVFEIVPETGVETILLLAIGTHDEVY